MTDEDNTSEKQQPKQRGQRKGKARRRGSGSVFRRPERKGGKEWVAQIILEDGSTRQRYFKTQAEADAALNEMLYEQRHGTLITEKDQTVKHLLEHWLENVHKPAIRTASYVEYRRIIDKHLIPALGHLKLQQLTIQRVEALYMEKQDGGLSAGSVREIHAVLHQALSYAVRHNLVSRNVCDHVTLPRLKRFEIQPLTMEQAQQLLVGSKGHRFEALYTLALTTGMREGELLALRWSDINFEQGYLQVRRTVRRIRGQGFKENEPKTAAGRRRIALSPFLIGVLKTHRSRQEQARQRAGSSWEEHDLVFCNIYGSFMDQAHFRATFQTILKKAGLQPMRFHDLRHSAATLLLAMGVHAKVVQELLGHSNISITLNIYSHVLPSLQQDAMNKLSDLFDQQD